MKANKTPIIIDSNIWISGILLKTGTPALLIQQLLKHGQPVFTQQTFAELEARLWRPKFDRYISLEQRKRLLHDIKAISLWVNIPPHIASQTFSRDADDDKFIHTALTSQTPYLVTGDKDLLVLAEQLRTLQIQILTPAQALLLPTFQV